MTSCQLKRDIKIAREVNKALRFLFVQSEQKLKQVLVLKLGFEKYCLHNLGEDQRKGKTILGSENKM